MNLPLPIHSKSVEERIAKHPCYSEDAHHHYSRVHLAVAPKCNIQCNYCNRKYDCSNECRPGVTSQKLSPQDALARVDEIKSLTDRLSVVGIAGPGDALANPERTFETLDLIKSKHPELTLCLSTNGLALPQYSEEVLKYGVEHITVTLNTFDPATAKEIYKWVRIDGKLENSLEAFEYFLKQQQAGIRKMIGSGALVKVNSLYIPGLNDKELPSISKKIKLMGCFLHNIMPLIARPEHGTQFGLQNWPEPSHEELESMRQECGDMKQMAHCRQCRADAAGLLGGLSQANQAADLLDIGDSPCGKDGSPESPGCVGYDPDRASKCSSSEPVLSASYRVAVSSKGEDMVNAGLMDVDEFFIYQIENGKPRLLNVRRLEDPDVRIDAIIHNKEIQKILSGCDAVVTLKAGYKLRENLESEGIKVVTDLAYFNLKHAVKETAVRLATSVKEARKVRIEAVPAIQ